MTLKWNIDGKKGWPAAVIDLDVFNLQVGVFRTDADRVQVLTDLGVEAVMADAAAWATAHMDTGPDGHGWFSMVIKDEATSATCAHECVHIADFVMDHLGIPTGAENTEVRAYLVGHLFSCLQEIMERKEPQKCSGCQGHGFTDWATLSIDPCQKCRPGDDGYMP